MDKPPSDYAAMRQALAKLSAESDKKDEIIRGMAAEVSKLKARVAEMDAKAAAFAAPLSELSRVPGFGPARAKKGKAKDAWIAPPQIC